MNARQTLFLAIALLASAAAPAASSAARVCVAPASVQMPGVSNDDAVDALRGTASEFLKGPSVTVMALSARLETHARDEARGRKCDFVFFTQANQERRTRGGGLLSRMVASAVEGGASQAAVHADSMGARAAASAAATGAHQFSYGYYTQTSDKLTVSTRLESLDGAVLSRTSESRKAKSDGEDMLTPLIERATAAAVKVIQSTER
jgi:hypothetical protein